MLRKLFRRFAEKNKQKFKKKFREKEKNFTDFRRFLWKKQPKILLFLRFFEEILMAIKAVIKHTSFSTNPSVSQKILKKCRKKCWHNLGHVVLYTSRRDTATKQKPKSLGTEPWKLNINLEKSECAGRARKRKTKSNNFFFK